MPDRELVSGNRQAEDLQFEVGLRPRRLADVTGQSKLKENLEIAIQAARKRGEAMDHVLLYGPPGLGKTTLASIIAEELGVPFTTTSGPVLQKKLDLTGILSNIRHRRGTRRALHHYIGSGLAEKTRPHRHSEQYPPAPGFLHRRDSPPDAGRGGDALLGAGGFPRGYPGGRGAGRADALAAHAEVHGHRRHYAAGSGERAAARALRPRAAPGPLLGGRSA